jgi:DnaJ family protein B protein 12
MLTSFTGGGIFDAGPQFVFNLGGGPGVRVHQFGGARPRRRPRDPNAPEEPPATVRSTLMGLLPLLILFVLPLLSSIFSGSSSSAAGPSMRFDGPVAPHTLHRLTARMKVDYYLNPVDVEHYTPHKFSQLDKKAEVNYVQQLRIGCEQELEARQRLINEAQGWFVQDVEKIQRARDMEMKSCKALDSLGMARNSY